MYACMYASIYLSIYQSTNDVPCRDADCTMFHSRQQNTKTTNVLIVLSEILSCDEMFCQGKKLNLKTILKQ